MKISTAALPFLILAAALGSLAHVSQTHRSQAHGVHRPPDCCISYTPQKIRCRFIKDYFATSSGCHLAAIIFITKKGQQVCVNPKDRTVQRCLKILTKTDPRSLPPISFPLTSSPGTSLA